LLKIKFYTIDFKKSREYIGYIRKRYNMETKQLKRIADAIEEILRLVREDMKEMKKAAK